MQPGHVSDIPLRRDALRPLLASRPFLIAIALLVINDWLLKPAFGNWITGKLSDVCGVFALPLLWSAFFPSRRKAGFVATALGFTLWKTPIVDAPLAAWNSLGIWHLSRVVDYTDWIALVALIPSYRLAERNVGYPPRKSFSVRHRLLPLVCALMAIVAFAADSVAPPRYAFPDIPSYTIPASRDDIRHGLGTLGFNPQGVTMGEARGRVADTLSFYIRQPPERDVRVTVEVREVLSVESRVKLIGATALGPEPSTSGLEQAFEKQVIQPLQDWIANRPKRQ